MVCIPTRLPRKTCKRLSPAVMRDGWIVYELHRLHLPRWRCQKNNAEDLVGLINPRIARRSPNYAIEPPCRDPSGLITPVKLPIATATCRYWPESPFCAPISQPDAPPLFSLMSGAVERKRDWGETLYRTAPVRRQYIHDTNTYEDFARISPSSRTLLPRQGP